MSKNTVTKCQIDEIMAHATIEVQTVLGKCTVVTCQLPNGFIIVESSACVDTANYDETMGKEICLKRIENKVWELEGYKLQSTFAVEGGYSTNDLADMNAEFGFDVAITLLKEGEKVARKGWNGKGMYLFQIGVEGSNDYWTYTNGKNDNYPLLSFIAMKTADDKVVPWLASQTDMLANDWMVVK
ncbi:MAG: BMBtpLA 7 [Neobacillus sp.]|jgi:hypothetical protein|nr:BMBtpLA 7 [Neobacillus sp.]